MLHPEYITGLVDGEGTFTYSYSKKINSIGLYLGIALNIKDLPLLKAVQEYFGCGRIYFAKAVAGKFKNPDYVSGARAYYRVNKHRDLLKVIRHFEEHPLHGQKAKAYQIWVEMVFYKGRMYRDKDMPKMLALAAKLSEANKRTGGKEPRIKNSEQFPKDPAPYFQYDHDSRYYDPTARYD